MFRKFSIALSIAVITAFLTPKIALAKMDNDHDQRASDSRSSSQLQDLADDFRDHRLHRHRCQHDDDGRECSVSPD
jgi:hypothetical protein